MDVYIYMDVYIDANNHNKYFNLLWFKIYPMWDSNPQPPD